MTSQGRARALAFLSVPLLLLGLYMLAYGGRFHVIDEVSIYAMSENFAKRGSLDTDQILWSQWVRSPREVQGSFGSHGHVYSKKGFGAALLPAVLLRIAMPYDSIGLTFPAFLSNQLWTALTALLIVLYLSELGYSDRVAIVTGLVYGTATLAFPYTRTLFGEPLVAFGIILSLYSLLKDKRSNSLGWALVGGIGFSLSVWTRLINFPVLFFLWLYQVTIDPPITERRLRRLLPKRVSHGIVFLFLALFMGVGGYLGYNIYRFGHLFQTGYHLSGGESFTTAPWIGLYGLILSPFRGIIWFSPLSFLILPGMYAFFRTKPKEALVISGIIIIYILTFCTWWMWWGGFAWGPRFLLPVVPLMTIPLASLWKFGKWRIILLILIIVSLFVQFVAVASDFTLTETELELVFGHPERSKAMYSLAWSPILLQWRHLKEGFWDIAWVHVGRSSLSSLSWLMFSILTAIFVMACKVSPKCRKLKERRKVAGLLIIALIAWVVGSIDGIAAVSEFAKKSPVDGAVVKAMSFISDSSLYGALITLAPFDYGSTMNWNHLKMYTLGLSPHAPPLRSEENHLLNVTEHSNGIIWVLTSRIHPGDERALPEKKLSEDSYAFVHRWFDDIRLVGFLSTTGTCIDNISQVNCDFDNGIRLQRVESASGLVYGEFLPVRTVWKADAPVRGDYTVFVHLLTQNGKYVSGFDGIPVNNYMPTMKWGVNTDVIDRRAILVPVKLAAGKYKLEIGMYDSITKSRITVKCQGKDVKKAVIQKIYLKN